MISWWLMIRFGSSHWLGVDGSQPLRRPIRSYPVHRRGRNVWRSSSAASCESRVASRFWDIQRLIQRASKNSKKTRVLMEPRITKNSVNHDISWCIITNPIFFSQVRFPIGGVCFATPEPQIWLRLAAFVCTRDHCRWQLEGFRCGSFSIALRMAELCQSKFMRFTIDLQFFTIHKSSCHEQIHDFLLKPESTHWWVHQHIFASQFRSGAA